MRRFQFLAYLTILVIVSLSSCSLMNTALNNSVKESNSGTKTQVELDKQLVRSVTLDVDNKKLDQTIKQQAFTIQTNNTQATPNGGLVDGLLVNRYNGRQVRWIVLKNSNDPNPPLDQILGPGQTISADLPIGQYTVQYYEFTVKGEVLYSTKSLSVTNSKNRGYNGASYFFVLVN